MNAHDNASRNTQKLLEQLKLQFLQNPTTAQQGLARSTPAKGQLHHLKESGELPEVFVLVIKTGIHHCEVIPGSFNALQGGPHDIVLPKNVMGDYVTLALDLATSLPRTALGTGFAKLDDETLLRILNSVDAFKGKDVKNKKACPFALPYIGKNDERIAYHARIASLLEHAKQDKPAPSLNDNCRLFLWNHKTAALAAGTETKDIRLVLASEDRGLSIIIEYSQPDRKLFVDVYGQDGFESHELDGCQLRAATGNTVLGTIQNGSLALDYPTDADGQLVITDINGHELPGKWQRL